MRQGFFKTIAASFIVALFLFSCSKSDDSTPNFIQAAGPQDTVTSFMVYFMNMEDSVCEVGNYDDPDGPGPMNPSIGGVTLKQNAVYEITMRIEDATGKTPVMLHNKIKKDGKDFKICLNNPLGCSSQALDSDGTLPIGLFNKLNTSSNTGYANMNFVIKYQKGSKNGDCSPGVTYYNCNIPIYIN